MHTRPRRWALAISDQVDLSGTLTTQVEINANTIGFFRADTLADFRRSDRG